MSRDEPGRSPAPAAGGFRILKPGPTRRMAAIQRLLGSDRARAERFLRFARDTGMSLDHVWCAFDELGAIRSTVLASMTPGRTAMLFLSPPGNREGVELGAEVIQHAFRGLAGAGTCLAQALVTPEELLEMQALERAGLRRIAILKYMEATLGRRERRPVELPGGCSTRAYREEDESQIGKLLARTYVDTLDCPGLVGMRGESDILEGHKHSGIFRPDWWTILLEDGKPVGVCLVNESKTDRTAELVYLGIVPEARGRGLGRMLLARSLSVIAENTVKKVVLAVDESNAPALDMYRGAGFNDTIRRHAFVRKLD
ncbi:MAG: GNAT family N-acetyltransferase [Planctomycetota bacterium]|nr:GNAT family N-acetyltransferase [Planctomycetota bacterium]